MWLRALTAYLPLVWRRRSRRISAHWSQQRMLVVQLSCSQTRFSLCRRRLGTFAVRCACVCVCREPRHANVGCVRAVFMWRFYCLRAVRVEQTGSVAGQQPRLAGADLLLGRCCKRQRGGKRQSNSHKACSGARSARSDAQSASDSERSGHHREQQGRQDRGRRDSKA